MAKRVGDLNFKPSAVRSYVAENFSVERMTRDYLALYEEILRGARTRAA
jgi:glycosyltransferase involved in cell wall biosynthesis